MPMVRIWEGRRALQDLHRRRNWAIHSGHLGGFAGGTSYAAYPSSGGLLLLEIDNAGITSGAAYPQTSTTFGAPEGYAFNLTGIYLGNPNFGISPEEVDDIAEFASNSSGLDRDRGA